MKKLKRLFITLVAVLMVLTYAPTKVRADEVFWVVKYDNNTGVLYAESTNEQPSGTYYASEEEAIAAYQAGAQATITYGGQTTYYANPYPALLHVNSYTGSTSADDLVMKLFADCNYETYDASFTISVPMTLDLNGHIMAFGQYGKKGYTYRFQKDFVLKDTSVGETGVLYGINNTAAILLGTSSAGSTFTLESGTIKSETAIFDTYSNCTINVTGGHMVSYSKYGVGDSRGIVAELSSGCALNISGGEFRSDQSAKSWDTMSFDPMGYPTKNVNANSTISVTGGTFSGQAIQKYVPGYTADQSFTNENPTITVGDYNITRTTVSSPYGAAAYDVYLYTVAPVPVNYVAQIGETQYTSLVYAINAANADTSSNAITIKLLADLDFSDDEYKAYKWAGSTYNPLRITRSNVTLDLNEKTISNMGNSALCLGSIYARDGVIENVTIKNGTLLAGTTDNVINSYALLIGGVNNCLVDSITTLGGINNCNNSDVIIKDSTIRGTKYYTVCAQTGADVTIRGTSYTKNTDQTVQTKAMFWVQGAGTDEDLITSSNPTGAFDASIIAIESGYFNVDSNGAFYLGGGLAPTLKGGYYNIDPTAYVADGYAVEPVSEEYEGVTYTYHVTAKKVAQIGETQYESFDEAVAAAQAGDTIVLLDDITFGTDRSVPVWGNAGEQPFNIDLNGHTFQTDSEVSIDAGNNGYKASAFCFAFDNEANITVSGGDIKTAFGAGVYVSGENVNLTLEDVDIAQNYPQNVQTTNEYSSAVRITYEGSVEINGGTYGGKNSIAVSNSGGKVVINDGTFYNDIYFSNYTSKSYYDNSRDAVKSITINGGNFLGNFVNPDKGNLVIKGGSFTSDPTAYVAEGYTVVASEDPTYSYKVVEDVTYVAKIGNVQYETLAAAVAAATDGDTIVLIDDLTISSYVMVKKNITLDLNGHTIEVNGGTYGLISSRYNLVITDSSTNGDGKIYSTAKEAVLVQNGGTLTVNGGTIEAAYDGDGYAIYVLSGSANVNAGNIVAGSGDTGIYARNASEVEINGGTVTSASWGIVMIDTSKLTVNDGTVTGNTYAISTNGTSGQNAQIVITGGTIGNENSGSGIYLPSGSLDVSGGTITGKTGIYFKSTNLNITGGEIVGVGPAVEYNYSGNGSNSTGDALVIDSCGYPNGIDNVNVSGGHFVSANAAAVKVYTYQENEPVEKFITGGIYNTLPDAEYVADGYAAIELPDGKFVVGVSSNTINGREGSHVVEIAPVIVTEGAETTAIVAPADVTTDKNTTTSITHSDLDIYAHNNGVDTVKIITGLSATQYIGSDVAPQTIITDELGRTVFEAVARGGQLRYDKKLEGTDVIGTYEQTHNKSTAIDYADVRLQFKFKLPEGVSVSDSNTSWNWTVTYTRANNEEVSKTVNGVNYLPVAGETNTFTSNVVITNVPVTANQGVNFKATLNITYVLNGVTYTISQSSEVPLARTIADMVNYYKGAAWYDLSDEAKAYIDGLDNYIG